MTLPEAKKQLAAVRRRIVELGNDVLDARHRARRLQTQLEVLNREKRKLEAQLEVSAHKIFGGAS